MACGARTDLPAPQPPERPPLCSQTLVPYTFTTAGHSFTARSATFNRGSPSDWLLISDDADACARDVHGNFPDGMTLSFLFWSPGPGQFRVQKSFSEPNAVSVRLDGYSGGMNSFYVDAVSGTTDVAVVYDPPCWDAATFDACTPCRGGRMAGHYDVTFPDGARAIGDFDAPHCGRPIDCVYDFHVHGCP